MNEKIEINVRKLRPFTRFIYTIGELPTSYLISMTYEEQLIWLCNYLEKTVIPAINNNGEAVEELQSKYIELKNYVDHYFDNLDVQEEVNNKLDEMASDGTLAEIINQEIFGELNEQVGTNTENIGSLQTLTENLPTDETNIASLIKFNQYTNKPLMYGRLNLPLEFSHYKFNLYRNIDNTINDDLDLSGYDTNNVLYVDRDNGNDNNNGSEASPKKTIKGALTTISSLSGNNWKIICKSYLFFRGEFISETTGADSYDMYKNIVIEPYDKTKKIVVTTAQETLSWTSDGNGVYHATRSSVWDVYDMTEKDVYGVYKKVTQADTLSDCQNTVNSYYKSGSTIYIHTKSGSAPTNTTYMINLALSTGCFNIRNNLWLRLKNIDFYVSGYMDFHNASSNYENTLICENVGIYYCGDNNGFSINNVKNVYLIDCKTGYNKRDGFNYHFTTMLSDIIDKSIVYEKNCVSFENGMNDENFTNNCSSIHEGGNIIRVNGVYKNSKGPVIADINSSKTMLINCGVNQEADNYAIQFQDTTAGSGEGVAYLIDCSSLQYQTLSLSGTDNFNIKLKNFKGNYENSDLNISLYNE